MDDQSLAAVIEQAERVARGVGDQSLKEKAFEVILNRLLLLADLARNVTESTQGGRSTANRTIRQFRDGAGKEPRTLSQRISALQDEGFFAEPKGIGKIREGLKVRGWHYPVTTLSGALQGFIQRRQLRREKVREGRKSIWKYSNP